VKIGGGVSDQKNISAKAGTNISSQVAVYTTSKIDDSGTLLLGGKGGLKVALSNNTNSSLKSKAPVIGFQVPLFTLEHGINKSPSAVENNNSEISTDIKIYSIYNYDKSIYVGGNFTYVNGVEKHNIVKLTKNGLIDNTFTGNVQGTVYDINSLQGSLFILGHFGAYNGALAHSIVKIDTNGVLDKSFAPFENYLIAKLNDMIVLPNNKIMVGGTFLKSTENTDENSSVLEVIENTSTIIVLDSNGTIDEQLTKKYADIKNEVFALDLIGDVLYIGGDFHFIKNNKYYNNVVSFDINGNFIESFQIAKIGGSGECNKFCVNT